MNIRLTVTFLLLSSASWGSPAQVFAQDSTAGLLFPQNNESWGSRGVLDLSPGTFLPVSPTYQLSFDISFQHLRYFGYILHLIDPREGKLILAIVPVDGREGSARLVISGGRGQAAELASVEIRGSWMRWFRISIELTPSKDRGRVIIGRNALELTPCSGLPAGEVGIRFGFLPSAAEVPPMKLMDVRLDGSTNAGSVWKGLHQWPLDETEGGNARDLIGGADGVQKECSWLRGSATSWTLTADIAAGTFDRAVFSTHGGRVFIIGEDRIQVFTPGIGDLVQLKNTQPLPGKPGYMKIMSDPRRTGLIAYHTGTGEVSVFDFSRCLWSPIKDVRGSDRFYDHVSFVDSATGKLYAFGGYGWYMAHSLLQSYNHPARCWAPESVTDDTVPEPRFSSVAAPANSCGKWYVFGGKGNADGHQTSGFNWFNDLWLLDLESHRWTRLWKLDSVQMDAHPIGLINPRSGGPLYLMASSWSGDTLSMKMFSMETSSGTFRELPGFEVIAGSTEPQFFDFNQERQEFLAAVRVDQPGGSRIRIYELRYPPIAVAPRGPLDRITWALTISVLIVLGAGAGVASYWLRLRGEKSHAPVPAVLAAPPRMEIRTLGGFKIVDAEGRNRAGHLPPRLKELFLMILLHSRTGTGVAAEALASRLWPHALPASAKNSRGVAIKKLRDILEDIGGIDLIWRHPVYLVEFSDAWTVDIIVLVRILDSDPGGDDASTGHVLADLLCRGPLLPELDYDWLPAVRTGIEQEIAVRCAAIAAQCGDRLTPGDALCIAESALCHDPMHEHAMRLKIRTLVRTGHHGKAIEALNEFSLAFHQRFGRPSPLRMSDLAG
jgi:hypothetical protein